MEEYCRILYDFIVKSQVLLDDVLSELDSSRQNYLLESIHNIQTMITCTGLDDFVSIAGIVRIAA